MTIEDNKAQHDKNLKTMTDTINQYTTEIENFKKSQLEFNSFKEKQMKVNGELKDIISKKEQIIDLENEDLGNHFAVNAEDKPADKNNIKVIEKNGKLAFVNLTPQDIEAIVKGSARLVIFEPPIKTNDKGIEITTYTQLMPTGYTEEEEGGETKIHLNNIKNNLKRQTKTPEQIQEVEIVYTIKLDGPDIKVRKYPNSVTYVSQLRNKNTNIFLCKENEYTWIQIEDDIKPPETVIKSTESTAKTEVKPTLPPVQPTVQKKIIYIKPQNTTRFNPRIYRNNDSSYNYTRPTYRPQQNTYRYNNTGFDQDRYGTKRNYRNKSNYEGYSNRPYNYRNQGYNNRPNNYRNQGYYNRRNNYNNKGPYYNNNK